MWFVAQASDAPLRWSWWRQHDGAPPMHWQSAPLLHAPQQSAYLSVPLPPLHVPAVQLPQPTVPVGHEFWPHPGRFEHQTDSVPFVQHVGDPGLQFPQVPVV